MGEDEAAAQPADVIPEDGIPGYTPPEGAIDISLDKKGKLYKEIKKEGESDEMPGKGEKVSVLYVGKFLDGNEFDKSTNENSPFTFELGEGKVIKGWDIGVATMKRGEQATFVIDYTLAYGDKGSGKIPGKAALVFDVTLLGWTAEDLSPDRKGGIIRKRIKNGELAYLRPNQGATAEVELEGTFEGRVFDKRKQVFDVGEGSEANICKGVEIAIEKFAKGDEAMLILKPEYAFGADGNKEFGIPPNATVSYKVHLMGFTKLTDVWNMNGQEKLEYSEKFKERGTKYFKQEKFNLAVVQYKRIVDYLKAEAMLTGDEEERRKALLLASYLNQAICWLKLEEFVKARNCAEGALELDPKNAKAHFRKGMANLMTKDYEIAVGDFETVMRLEPDNKAAQHQLQIARQKMKEEAEITKQLYSKMFKYNCKYLLLAFMEYHNF